MPAEPVPVSIERDDVAQRGERSVLMYCRESLDRVPSALTDAIALSNVSRSAVSDFLSPMPTPSPQIFPPITGPISERSLPALLSR